MANNKRVKLTADLIEAASKHNCTIPKSAIKEILNDKDNMAVFRTTAYADISLTVSTAKKLIGKRAKAIEELY
jgi:hypothetical protein